MTIMAPLSIAIITGCLMYIGFMLHDISDVLKEIRDNKLKS